MELPLHPIPEVVFARITFPLFAPMAMEPLTSGVGIATPAAPLPRPTRKYWPGAMVPESACTLLLNKPVPVGLVYWIE